MIGFEGKKEKKKKRTAWGSWFLELIDEDEADEGVE